MTIAPKVEKYRIRNVDPAAASSQGGNDPESLFEVPDDGFGDEPFPTAAQPDRPDPTEAQEIAAIQAEGLTGRQLRLARRMALRNGIDATSDHEAVRLLRRRGIDPFDRGGVVHMIHAKTPAAALVANPAKRSGKAGGIGNVISRALARIDKSDTEPRVQLPQTTQQNANLPAPQLYDEDSRARQIIRIQRDIAKRRRRKLLLLMTRLAFFVFLPTLMAGWYYYAMATPLYATKTEFVIQQADQGIGGGGGGLSGMLKGTGMATSQDSITVQSYLNSREALMRLDNDMGFKTAFSNPEIDAIQRLPEGATNEKAYKLYRRNVKIGYDPTEGIIKMEVIAPNPELSVDFSESLISYAEEQVDQLTQRLREDQMRGARDSYDDAEAKVLAAQQKVLELQEQLGILDPVSETNVVMTQVSNFEIQLQQKRLQLQQLLDNDAPNQARVDGVQGDIERLEMLIAELRSTLTQRNTTGSSLAAITGKLRIAEAELQTRQLLLSGAAQQMELARIEANKQVRYLSMGVRPIAPDEPTYPRSFESTLLAFLIFSGIYLMLSLTASILREQVSS
ncbi:capsule biosynthesis protein [Phaeovulum sp.]|uniref:capsule biosynthesis protein n=1 Tax=Phaeovulum sp. TaxID=2934796 RepID=UPI0039E5E3E6